MRSNSKYRTVTVDQKDQKRTAMTYKINNNPKEGNIRIIKEAMLRKTISPVPGEDDQPGLYPVA